MNGNGDGKSTGKPCAGCVGKADNKNPKGQMPGGSDHNNGYECDGNKGIGRGNPAHTSCVPPIVTPPGDCVPTPTQDANCNEIPPCVPGDEECPIPPCVPGDEECPVPPCVPGAEECPVPPCVPAPTVPCITTPPGTPGTPPGDTTPPEGVELNRPPVILGAQASQPAQAPAPAAQPATGALPNTGAGDLTGLLAASGVGLLIVGGATLAMRRRSVTA